jgi:hypothetical protein
MTTIRKIQPRAHGWWGDEDCGVTVRIWGETTEQGTVKISYISGGYEQFEYVPAKEVQEYPKGATV